MHEARSASYDIDENVTQGSESDDYTGSGSTTLDYTLTDGEYTDYTLSASDTVTRDQDYTQSQTLWEVDVTVSTTETQQLNAGGTADVTTVVDSSGATVATYNGQSQTYPYNGHATYNSTAAPQDEASLIEYSQYAEWAFGRNFQQLYNDNPTGSLFPYGLGTGVTNSGSATGSHLRPNGPADNGLDPVNDTKNEHAETAAEGTDVQHAPPEKAEPAQCDCNCGEDGQGIPYLDQTSDMVGELHGDTITRGTATRSLTDVQDYDEDNPNATPEDWDAFFAEGGSAAGLVAVDLADLTAPRRQGVIIDLSETFDRLDELREQVRQRQSLADAMALGQQLESENLKAQVSEWAEDAYQARLLREAYDRGLASITRPESPAWSAITSFWHSPFAQVGGAFVPGVGESMDAEVLADPEVT